MSPVSGLRELKIPALDTIRNDSLLDQHLGEAKIVKNATLFSYLPAFVPYSDFATREE